MSFLLCLQAGRDESTKVDEAQAVQDAKVKILTWLAEAFCLISTFDFCGVMGFVYIGQIEVNRDTFCQ